MVKVPSKPASLAGTFFTCGVVTLVLLLLQLSSKSSIGATHAEGACFLDSLLASLLSLLFPLLSLMGTVVVVASAVSVSHYILSTQMIVSFSFDGIEMIPSGPGIFRVL